MVGGIEQFWLLNHVEVWPEVSRLRMCSALSDPLGPTHFSNREDLFKLDSLGRAGSCFIHLVHNGPGTAHIVVWLNSSIHWFTIPLWVGPLFIIKTGLKWWHLERFFMVLVSYSHLIDQFSHGNATWSGGRTRLINELYFQILTRWFDGLDWCVLNEV